MGDKKTPGGGAIEVGSKVTVAAAGALIGTGLAGPVGGAAGAMISVGLDEVRGFVMERLAKRQERWWERARTRLGGADLQDQVRNNPKAQEAIIESWRRLETAVSEDVVPILGDLVADYMLDEKPTPDWFFRCLSRLLADIDNDELDALARFAAAVAALNHEDVDVFERMNDGMMIAAARSTTPGTFEETPLGEFPHILRLFHLMKMHGLGRDGRSGTFGGQPGPKRIVVEIPTMRRVAMYLAPPA